MSSIWYFSRGLVVEAQRVDDIDGDSSTGLPQQEGQTHQWEFPRKGHLASLAVKVAEWDPTICQHCKGPMSEPRMVVSEGELGLRNQWLNHCLNCGSTRGIPENSPLLRQYKQDFAFTPYPNLLKEIGGERPWVSKVAATKFATTSGDYVNHYDWSSAPSQLAAVTSEYNGYSNWDTWNTKLMMDNEEPLYRRMHEIVGQGGGPHELRQWGEPSVIGPYNKDRLQDAQEWNAIHPDERRRMIDERDRAEFGDAAVDMGRGILDAGGLWQDPGKDDTADLIDPHMVNWDEIHHNILSEYPDDHPLYQQYQNPGPQTFPEEWTHQSSAEPPDFEDWPYEKQEDWWDQHRPARATQPEFMYHVSPVRNRQQIRSEGLDPSAEQMNPSGHEPGAYLWDDPEVAWKYRGQGPNMYKDMDVHAVDTTGLKLLPDRWLHTNRPERNEDFPGAWYSVDPVPADRVTEHAYNPWFSEQPETMVDPLTQQEVTLPARPHPHWSAQGRLAEVIPFDTPKDHQLWFKPGPRAERLQQWGRGLYHEPTGIVHTWPETEGTHVQMMEAKGLNPLESVKFSIWPNGTLSAPSLFHEAINQADPRLTVPKWDDRGNVVATVMADWTGPGEVNLTTDPPQQIMQEGPSPWANNRGWQINIGTDPGAHIRDWLMHNYPETPFYVGEGLGGWRDAEGAPFEEPANALYLYDTPHPKLKEIVDRYGLDHPDQEALAVMPANHSQLWQNRHHAGKGSANVHTAMAADPNWLQRWIVERGHPYMFHGAKSRIGEDPEVVAQRIVTEGIRPDMRSHEKWPPWTPEEEAQGYRTDENYDELDGVLDEAWHNPRPGHVFLTDRPASAYGPPVFRVDLSKLDPHNLNPDDDYMRDQGKPTHYKQTVPPKSLGEQAEEYNWGQNPDDTHGSLEYEGNIAHRGVIPPEALNRMPDEEWQQYDWGEPYRPPEGGTIAKVAYDPFDYDPMDPWPWQQGRCGTYACALLRANPALKWGELNGEAQHFFAHDDDYAYDSLGRHPLATYRGLDDWARPEEVELNSDPSWFGMPDEEAGPEGPEPHIQRALQHIRANHPWFT